MAFKKTYLECHTLDPRLDAVADEQEPSLDAFPKLMPSLSFNGLLPCAERNAESTDVVHVFNAFGEVNMVSEGGKPVGET